MSSTTVRHLQESSGRQTFGSFHIVSPSFVPCHASLVAEPVRSAMEDCFRIVIRDDCLWKTSYVGLGNAECRSDDENDSSSSSSSNNNDTVTIMGGVIDFIDATTIPSTSEVVDCLDMALQSTTCLVSIQSYFPMIDQIRYEYLSESIGAPAPTFPPVVRTTETDDNLMSSSSSSSATTPNQDDTSTTSSSQLVIPLAVVGSCAMVVAILGFLFVSRMAAHRSSSSKQRTSSTEIQDITTSSIVTDDPDGNRSDEADMETGVETANHDDDANDESTTITDYNQHTYTREEERTTISYQDLCRDDISPTRCFSGHVVEDAAVTTHDGTATMKINNHTHEPDDTMGYVSSDSEHHSDDEDLEVVVLSPQESTPGTSKSNPILLVPLLQYYLQKSTDNVEAPHDMEPCHHEANHVQERHVESSWNKDGRSILPGAPFVVEQDDDDDDDDDEDFALDYSWDPDDDSTTAILEEENSFSVTKTQVIPLLSTTTPHTERRRRRGRTNHATTQKFFSISPRRRPHVVTPSSSHYHDPIPSPPPPDDKSNHPSLTDSQFRRSRSFVIVLPTSSSSSSSSCGGDPTRRCRSAPRPVVGR